VKKQQYHLGGQIPPISIAVEMLLMKKGPKKRKKKHNFRKE
jgi:hypothetical protein